MKGFRWITSVDLSPDKSDDGEIEKFQSSLEIGRGTSEQLIAENAFKEFQYLDRETFKKA
jgi:hypothetical protein